MIIIRPSILIYNVVPGLEQRRGAQRCGVLRQPRLPHRVQRGAGGEGGLYVYLYSNKNYNVDLKGIGIDFFVRKRSIIYLCI